LKDTETYLKEIWCGACGIDWCGSVWGPVVTSYEDSNEILSSTKGNKLFSVSAWILAFEKGVCFMQSTSHIVNTNYTVIRFWLYATIKMPAYIIYKSNGSGRWCINDEEVLQKVQFLLYRHSSLWRKEGGVQRGRSYSVWPHSRWKISNVDIQCTDL